MIHTLTSSQSVSPAMLRALSILLSLVALCGGCGANAATDVDSTDTGNPPVSDQSKIGVVQAERGVRVVGQPGAVTPGGAEVTVTHTPSGANATTRAGADGSFSVEVEGTVGDAYQIDVEKGDRSSGVELLGTAPGCGAPLSGCSTGALSDGSFCGDSGEDCIELAELSQGCIGSHTEQECDACGQAFTIADGYLYFDGAGLLVAVRRIEEEPPGASCGAWFGIDLSNCIPRGESRQVPCAAMGGELPAGPELECLARSEGSRSGNETRGAEPYCQDVNSEAFCRIDETLAAQSLECSDDEDCTVASFSAECVDRCGAASVVATAAVPAIEAALSTIDAEVCTPFEEAGCSYLPSGCPPPPPVGATCRDGRCAPVTGCALGEQSAARLVADAGDSLAEGCTSDEQCLQRYPSCPWGCTVLWPTLVAEARLADYEALATSLEEACEFARYGEECAPAATLSCEAPVTLDVQCDQGRCVPVE